MATMLSICSSFVVLILFSFLVVDFAVSTSDPNQQGCKHHVHHHHHHETNNKLRSLNFTIYQHGTLNKTDILIVPGIESENTTNALIPTFGSMYIFDCPLKTSPDPSSEVVGKVLSLGVTSSVGGHSHISVGKVTLDLKHPELKGSISIATALDDNFKPSDASISGGTGDFMFVQGYITSRPFSFTGLSYVYKFDYHIFWPPYAPLPAAINA